MQSLSSHSEWRDNKSLWAFSDSSSSSSSSSNSNITFHGSLFITPPAASTEHQPQDINPQLVGAKCADDALVAYENLVGFSPYPKSPSETCAAQIFEVGRTQTLDPRLAVANRQQWSQSVHALFDSTDNDDEQQSVVDTVADIADKIQEWHSLIHEAGLPSRHHHRVYSASSGTTATSVSSQSSSSSSSADVLPNVKHTPSPISIIPLGKISYANIVGKKPATGRSNSSKGSPDDNAIVTNIHHRIAWPALRSAPLRASANAFVPSFSPAIASFPISSSQEFVFPTLTPSADGQVTLGVADCDITSQVPRVDGSKLENSLFASSSDAVPTDAQVSEIAMSAPVPILGEAVDGWSSVKSITPGLHFASSSSSPAPPYPYISDGEWIEQKSHSAETLETARIPPSPLGEDHIDVDITVDIELDRKDTEHEHDGDIDTDGESNTSRPSTSQSNSNSESSLSDSSERGSDYSPNSSRSSLSSAEMKESDSQDHKVNEDGWITTLTDEPPHQKLFLGFGRHRRGSSSSSSGSSTNQEGFRKVNTIRSIVTPLSDDEWLDGNVSFRRPAKRRASTSTSSSPAVESNNNSTSSSKSAVALKFAAMAGKLTSAPSTSSIYNNTKLAAIPKLRTGIPTPSQSMSTPLVSPSTMMSYHPTYPHSHPHTHLSSYHPAQAQVPYARAYATYGLPSAAAAATVAARAVPYAAYAYQYPTPYGAAYATTYVQRWEVPVNMGAVGDGWYHPSSENKKNLV